MDTETDKDQQLKKRRKTSKTTEKLVKYLNLIIVPVNCAFKILNIQMLSVSCLNFFSKASVLENGSKKRRKKTENLDVKETRKLTRKPKTPLNGKQTILL